MPRTPRRITALLLAGATLATLAACAPAEPEPTAAPTSPSETADAPVFASDEEALAAAVAAYEAYLVASDAITADGGEGVDRIDGVTSAEFAKMSKTDFAAFRHAGLRTEGATAIDSPRLIEVADNAQAVSFYACQDVSSVRVLNSAQEDVTPSDRDPRLPLVIEAVAEGPQLVIDGNQVWSGDDFC
ncbi:hypothetical protein ACFPER_02600 [Agromyces aurantiacus]|uniref:Lipoprotein n=1 Tax=Agromyces aurantiacus TaxID=165814 RepID=A0ABV9R2H7_9MICO|nr:hypothetical protein [Agromyces aurantiacus]MBM7505978.1 hypothetical protein [Agromyces aurantiacus]